MATTYDPIATYTVSGTSTNNITFSSIPATYTDLVLIFNGSLAASLENLLITINSDTGSNYSGTWLQGTGSAAQTGRNSNQSIWYGGSISTTNVVATYHFMNYANTTTYKSILHKMSNPTTAIYYEVGLWRSTSAINTIKVSNSNTYTNGTMVSLYGIKAA